jgi:carbonic anhydrase
MTTANITPRPTAAEALARLKAGNERFLSGNLQGLGQTRETLADLAQGQTPFVTILGCSDSRVAPELIFDAGLGELFIIRVAGNVLTPEIAGTLQYAGSHLDTPLFVVLGHEGCGAVAAALASKFDAAPFGSRIQILLETILPALEELDPQLTDDERLAQAIESNVRWTMEQIEQSPEGRMRAAEGRMKIVGAIYEIATGRVRWLLP